MAYDDELEFYVTIKSATKLWDPTDLQRKLMQFVKSRDVKLFVNETVANEAVRFIPMGNPDWDEDAGALRDPSNREIGVNGITYLGPHAAYQYEGEVWGPNFPNIWREVDDTDTVLGEYWGDPPWYRDGSEAPTGRMLGENPGKVALKYYPLLEEWTFGYNIKGTTHHWIWETWDRRKQMISNKITGYLKRKAKEKGFK